MPPYVLLVEDDANAAELSRRAFAEHGRFDLLTLDHGRAALDFLHRRGDYAAREDTLPDLVILDLGLPDLPGLDVLRDIRRSEHLRHLPVIILTVSENPDDAGRARELGANFFISKPVRHKEFAEAARAVSTFWFTTARTPQPPRPL